LAGSWALALGIDHQKASVSDSAARILLKSIAAAAESFGKEKKS
jgi:hypothetical protein